MKNNFCFSFIVFIIITIYSCRKSDDKAEQLYGDSLTEEVDEFVTSCSVSNPTLKNLLGAEGNPLGRLMNVQGLTSNLINGILTEAQMLSGQKILTYPSEGNDKPEHMGLVYSKGQRDITQRLKPPLGNDIHKKYWVYGTDCSGLMIILLRNMGINIGNTNVASFENTLNAAFKDNDVYNALHLENLGKIEPNQIKSGDFILWIKPEPDNNHMGIIAITSYGTKVVFQSNGTGNPKTEEVQAQNLLRKKGVHPIDFEMATTGNGYWGPDYTILRITEKDGIDPKQLTLNTWQLKDILENGTSTIKACEKDDEYKFNANGSFWMTPYNRCRPADGTIEDWGCNCRDGWKFEENNTKLSLKEGSIIQNAVLNYYFRNYYDITSFSRSVTIKRLTSTSFIVFDLGVNITLEFKAK